MSARSLVLSGLVLVPTVIAQAYDPGSRSEGAFTYVQPLGTTILTQYGSSPPVYPSPNITGTGGWSEALVKAQAFVAQLTLEEKSDMVTGTPGPCVGNIVAIPRLDFPGLCLQDGPLAIRVADYASAFEAGVAAAATWDRDILYTRGYAMAEEFKAKGAHIALTPVAGPLGRSAYSGRNWEGFAADPYLTGVSMYQTIRGFNDVGVQACAKHFLGNEQETMRNPVFDPNGTITDKIFESISSNIDDRTLHEIYLWPFADAVKAGTSSIMCPYNRVNGSYGCQNSKMLNGLLKTELGFQGYVMSDWGSTHTGVAGILAGQDLDMPGGLGLYGLYSNVGSFFGANITTAVNNGSLAESRVDDMITRIMTPYYFHGQDQNYPTVDPSSADLNTFSPKSTWFREFNLTGPSSRDVRGNHSALIRRQAAEATVLLKNENNALPLKAPKSIAVFGNDATQATDGLYIGGSNYEFGVLPSGGGSGGARFSSLVSPLEAIKARASQDRALVQYWLNNTLVANSEMPALWVPALPDVCLVFLKDWAEESVDRLDLSFDFNGTEVVTSVAKYCNNTVVITHSPGINTIPFADNPNVTAILQAHYAGEEVGNSIVDVLYGDVNPSGRLPYTIAYNESDYTIPVTTDIQTDGIEDWQAWYDEKLNIDYRYFDSNNISVRYEFGYGLSYTTFELADLAVSCLADHLSSAPDFQPTAPGGNPALWETVYHVTANVKNTGDVSGAAVAQLYVTFPDSTPAGTPPYQLRGFDKVFLEVNETKAVTFELMRRDISFWDIITQEWLIPSGDFTLNVGFSSRDFKDTLTISPIQV